MKQITAQVCAEMRAEPKGRKGRGRAARAAVVQPKKWRVDALHALHIAAEHYLTTLMSKGYLASAHAGRITLQKEDLALVQQILQD